MSVYIKYPDGREYVIVNTFLGRLKIVYKFYRELFDGKVELNNHTTLFDAREKRDA